MTNQVTLTFAGDSQKLEKAFKDSTAGAQSMESAVKDSGSKSGKALDKLSSSATYLTEGISGLGDSINILTNLSKDGAERADRYARAQNDVAQAAQDLDQALGDARQATLDLSQSQRDSAQAALDVEQADLDAEKATQDYALAVKEHGKNSIEARQASLDLKQAQEDVKQAQEDAKQATEDGSQANRDLAQAGVDAKDAQLNLNQAHRDAVKPNAIGEWTDRLSAMAPLLFTVIGATQLFTVVNWGLTASFLANPITWIVLAVVALIAAIVLIATKTTWFQDAWNWAWGGIKTAAVAVWDWLKLLPGRIGDVFKSVSGFISAPFRAAFNYVSDAWNNTIGRLSWSVPSWVPFIGGNTISVPHLPKFHAGGVVPGAPGTEMMAILQAGERVTPAGSSGGSVLEIRSSGSRVDDLILEILRNAVSVRGGNVQIVVGT